MALEGSEQARRGRLPIAGPRSPRPADCG